MNESSRPTSTCPRCQRSTGSPFVVGGVCLRCAGERVFALDSAELRPPPATGDNSILPRRLSATVPERIGPYEIIEELGRGGMGYIYAARQVGLGRIVALKVLGAQGEFAALDLRFLREAQTVARLRHPNIIGVHDSGRADGYVYFSMDYIADGDLGRRLRVRPFSPRESAALLAKVAGAVAAAHAEGVLHRDIKPSNILLDGDEPKLADFGLAAQLEAGGDLTAVSGVLGTPHYLAPEALRGGSAALTVTSDVYALGAVLFELLTGRPPFGGVSPAELATLVLTTEPPSPRLVAPAVPVDLETICLKCLEREPVRRYPTAAALAADLQRFLDGRPIAARPPSAWDRVRKFAGRHRVGFATGTVASLMLIFATAVSVTLALRARRAERHAIDEAAAATALSDFLEHDLLAQADPGEQPDRNITLHSVLDRAAGKIDARFAQQPLVAADLHAVTGEVYDSLGDYNASRVHLEKTLALRRQQLGEQDPQTLTTMHELAGSLYDCGRLDEAQAMANRVLVLREKNLGPDHRNTIESAILVAMLLDDRGHTSEADALASQTVTRARRALKPDDQFLNSALQTLGGIRLTESRLGEAESLMREAADGEVRRAGPESFSAGSALNDLATVYRQEGKLAQASELYERVLAIRRKILGPDNPSTVILMNNLAGVYKAENRLADAEKLETAAIEVGARTEGRDHPRMVIMLGNLADTYRREGKLDQAIATMTETMARARTVHGPKHPVTRNAVGGLGRMLLDHGEPTKAEPLLREAIGPGEQPGTPAWKVESWRSALGATLVRLGRTAEAKSLLFESYDRLHAVEPQIPPTQREIVPEAGQRIVDYFTAIGDPMNAAAWRDKLTKPVTRNE